MEIDIYRLVYVHVSRNIAIQPFHCVYCHIVCTYYVPVRTRIRTRVRTRTRTSYYETQHLLMVHVYLLLTKRVTPTDGTRVLTAN